MKKDDETMPVLIALLRGINVGGNNKIKMDALRALFLSLKFRSPRTYVQSGNVIFQAAQGDPQKIAKRIQQGIQRQFGCRPEVILRTAEELHAVTAKNPFAGRSGIEPAKLLVSFLLSEPRPGAREELNRQKFSPEELHLVGRELYIYFPNGIGKSKLPWSRLDKILGTSGTGRNWNSVTKMLEMAEALASGAGFWPWLSPSTFSLPSFIRRETQFSRRKSLSDVGVGNVLLDHALGVEERTIQSDGMLHHADVLVRFVVEHR